jgi:hypothetical protein
VALVRTFGSADKASEVFPFPLWGRREDFSEKLRGLHEGKECLENYSPSPPSPTFTVCLYALVLFEKTNYGTFHHSP